MRFISLLSAILVVAVLYLVLIERDALFTFARGEGLDAAIAVAREDDAPAGSAEAAEAPVTNPAETPGPADAPSGDAMSNAVMEETPEAASEEAGADQGAPIRVVALKSIARPLDNSIQLRGQTEAARQVELRAETSSTVLSAPISKGTLVSQGDLLCKLDAGTRETSLAEAEARLAEAEASVPTAEARVIEAEALLEEAQINYTAADKLSEGGFASSTTLASRRAAVRSAEATLSAAKAGLSSTEASISAARATVAAAEKEIERLQIHAPFDGLLESDTAEIGAYLQAGGLCATLYDLDPIRLTGYLPETEVERANLGAQARALLTASGREVTGKVTFLSRSADPTTRTFRVEIDVPNPDLAIRDGQTATISIASGGVEAHLLPQSALTLNDEGELGVRVVGKTSLAEFVPVEILRDSGRGIWVTGLPDQADVIVIGQEYVVAGVPVLASYDLPGAGEGDLALPDLTDGAGQ
ncbi:efflux RND transporter periplasmic adaptor subunit [Pseudooceanicola sp. HF7]|uniref:efflux RND transporter periplasmic adaptor subunit n=1 Tax=Pseudooceanicola sp. HF7 TaxID=2721560 RepID=UPI001430BC7F|nr:efflux RND transporter periplasmic adaptor subunit [Pseudooceanicola sp. HF7]NIZ10646.1 efflux RND transporter periplasmic adaptor subunit [Pseudooceanicola sp. HF7]